MKKILLFLLLTLPVLLYAQYPTTGNKQRLGWQTTGDGLVYRAAGLPSYTPTTLNNAYTYIDTNTGRVYRYSNGAWRDLSSEKYIRKIDETILASQVKDSLSIYDWFFVAMELTSGATSDKAVQLPVTGLDSTYAGRIVRVSALDSSATYNVSVVSSSPDGIAIGDSLTTSYTLQNGETAELQLYVFDTIYQWRITFRRSFELPADNVTGNGTTNYLSRWIAPFTLGTAGISDDGSEIQFARPTVLYGVNTSASATYGTFGIDNTLGIERPTYYNGSAWIPWLAYSGGTNQYSYFSSSNTITSGTQLFRSATGVEIGDGNYFKLPNNTTVGSMLGSTAGRMEFNSTAQNLSFRTSTATEYPVKSAYSTGLGTNTRVGYFDANGRLTDDADLTFDGTTLSTGTAGNIRGAVGRIASNAGRCNSPEGGIAQVGGTGAIQINLPTGVFGGGGGLRQFGVSFDVVVTKYVGGSTQALDRVTFVVNGDNSPGIYQAYAYSVGTGNNMQGLTWRIGISGSGGTIRVFLGELTSSLGKNVVSVENVSYVNNFGTSASISELCNGWSISLQSSSFGTIARSGLVIPQYGRIYNFSNEGGLTIHRDVNAFHRARYQGSFSGAHEITLPPATANLTGNVPFQIRGGLVFGSIANLREFIIEGVYSYASKNFSACNITWPSGTPTNLPVRFGDDGTNGKIWIGALSPTDAASTVWTGSFLYIYDLVTYNLTQSAHQDFYKNFPALQTESTAFNNIDITIPAYPSGVIPYSSSLGFTYSSDFLKTATQFKAGNYTFNTDQSVGAGQNGYVQTYNHSTGEIELQAPPAGYTGITRTIYDGDAALPDSTVTVNGTFNAGFWRVPESMDGYTLTKASFGIFDKGDMSTSGATYSFGVQKCNGSNMSCSNSSNVNFTPSSETELELTLSITLNANDILRVNYQPPQGCGGGCGTENVNGLVVTYTIQEN